MYYLQKIGKEIKNMDNYQEYITFFVTTKDGDEIELAVVDEFDFEKKHYVVGSLIQDDVVNESEIFIYECLVKKDGFTVQKIKRDFDYRRIAQAYMALNDEEKE